MGNHQGAIEHDQRQGRERNQETREHEAASNLHDVRGVDGDDR
jgi:hypothetical protein